MKLTSLIILLFLSGCGDISTQHFKCIDGTLYERVGISNVYTSKQISCKEIK